MNSMARSGRYQTSEVLREGLRLMERREAEAAAHLEALRAAASAGIADIEAGRFRTFEAVQSMREYLDALAATATADDNAEP